jgi:heavy metal sensor kinase
MFFLVALAVVLAGFSVSLYLTARSYLHRQLEERLEAALDTLAAAAELEPDGIDWEPHERRLTLGRENTPEEVRWLVRDQNGRIIDQSQNLATDDALIGALERTEPEADLNGQRWRLLERRLIASDHLAAALQAHPDLVKYRGLILSGALAEAPTQASLTRLALTLATLSLGLWSIAALVGRWLCRRALAPLTRMASAARRMSAATWNHRLPEPGTADELQDLGYAFNDLLARLHEAFVRQQRFTGDASHQLRTPLAVMLGQIEVALRRQRPVEEYQQVLSVVHEQAQNLRHIVEMLLFLARADGEGQLPSLESVNLATWLPEYLTRWAEHPRAVDVQLETNSEQSLSVQVQPALLGQLLDNLVDNAFKYSVPGTPIRILLGRDDGWVTCAVEDTGCGIATEDLARVFEPFFRSAEARLRGSAGVGLGLAVAQRIASAFGGMLQAKSRPEEGSCFTLFLPAVVAKVPPQIPQTVTTG